MKKNCYLCANCRKTGQWYICDFKKCRMGKTPYYPEFVPERAMYNYGIRVCIFIPRHDERGIYKKCPVCGERLDAIKDENGSIEEYFCRSCCTVYKSDELEIKGDATQEKITRYL